MKLKKTIVALGLAGVLLTSGIVFSEPGSESDPVISLSYLNIKIDELKSYIDEKIKNISFQTPSSSGNDLVVVELQNGQSIIGKSGTEFIKRSGNALAITSPSGGLSDVTSGVDIGDGKSVPDNHLLIIPRDDGRGMFITKDKTFIMVRGDYNIQ
ncbi:MAG: hypothetical protein RBR71_08525 [Gudongella sp.]|nr:hypothetical protein [Gudongella sp.]